MARASLGSDELPQRWLKLDDLPTINNERSDMSIKTAV
jgi:hypothetical protein